MQTLCLCGAFKISPCLFEWSDMSTSGWANDVILGAGLPDSSSAAETCSKKNGYFCYSMVSVVGVPDWICR